MHGCERGVRVEMGITMPRTPLLYPETVRWRIPGQSEAEEDDIVTCAWRATYTSAVQHRGEVEAVLRD